MDSGESVMARMSINGAQREDGVASEIADLLVGVQQKKYRSAHMTGNSSVSARPISPIPPDDLQRTLTFVRPNEDHALPHIGLVGDTYTILLKGRDTAGRYCLIDMHVPPGGGPPPHRHDFEESFIVLEGEIETTFRGVKSIVRTGETVNIPANAPHQFRNASDGAVRLLCICSPAGQEDFFAEVGVPVATRTTPPPALDPAAQAAFRAKAEALAPKYRTEFLERA
jgi:quercetin dioxygenase-like cupin family protein